MAGREPGRYLVFNELDWPRTGLVRLPGSASGAGVTDVATGAPLTVQAAHDDVESGPWALVADVPPLGYRVLATTPDASVTAEDIPFERGDTWLDGPFYRVEVSPTTGGITRLYDKRRGRDLLDPDSGYHLNQCLYWTGGIAAGAPETEYTPRRVTIAPGALGPLFAQLVVRTQTQAVNVTTTITLYAHLDRIDLHNEVEKEPGTEKEELGFVFPFQVPDRRYRVESPGAIITAGDDQLPGAGQAITAVRHFVDVSNDDYGVTLTMAESGFVEFGHRTSLEDPQAPDPTNSTLVVPVLGNWINWGEVTRDQAGQRQFTFRFGVAGHDGGFDAVQALHTGWEANLPLEAATLSPAGEDASLGPVHSFGAVESDQALLSCLKVGEEGDLIARVWAFAGRPVDAVLPVDGLGAVAAARLTDLLERDGGPLPVEAGAVTLPVQAGGITTCRLIVD